MHSLELPGAELYTKLGQLKAERGGLTAADERQHAAMRRQLEAEVLAHADVVRFACGLLLCCCYAHIGAMYLRSLCV